MPVIRRRKEKTVVLTVKVPRQVAEKVARFARKQKSTRSKVIRDALQRMPEREMSVGELGADLWGTASGPADLSTNPKWMKGFGE